MANAVLEVAITLDTGEVKKGFIAIQSEAEKAGKGSGGALTDGFSRGQAALVALSAGVSLIKESFEAIREVADKAFDFAKEGEEISAIGKRFEILGNQAGVVPEKIANGIERAVDGTVDMEDAMKKASESFVELGAASNRLPEIFELARKSAQVFGGDTIQRVDQISAAVASGSTRMLRQIGIIVDANKAYAEYAKSLGVTAGFLSKEQQQQALLNAVLQTGNEKFKDINGSLTPLAEKSKKLSVAFKELGDTAAITFNNIFGDILKRRIDSAVSSLEVLNLRMGEVLLGKIPNGAENVKLLTFSINELIKSQDIASAHGDIGRVESIGKEIEALNQKLLIQKQIDNQEKTKAAQPNSPTNNGNAFAKLTFDQQEQLRKLTLQGEQSLSAGIKANLDQRKQDHDLYFADQNSVTEAFNQSIISEQLRFQSEEQGASEQYKNLRITNEALYNSIIEQLAQNHALKIKEINRQFVLDGQQASGEFADGFTSAFDRMKAQSQALSGAFKNGLVGGITSGIASMSASLLKGQGFFGNFGNVILGIFGNMATQIGEVLIGIGIGITSLFSLNGLAAVAAGIGLVAIGSILSGIAAQSNESTPDQGGGVAAKPTSTSITNLSNTTEQATPTVVNVNVHGDIYDKTDTGLRIGEILRDTFNQTGMTLPQGMVTG